ncbi:MAG: hypothetical protein OFPI_18240 [Osedax symbiont Rs2]|nr:MAG: hypothetical protein OFPI_18240 [Osedax symbiont Rs2]
MDPFRDTTKHPKARLLCNSHQFQLCNDAVSKLKLFIRR